MQVTDIVDFILTEGDGLYSEQYRPSLTKAIEGHLNYNTLLLILDGEKIKALARLNIEGTTAYVLDVVIRKGEKGLLHELIHMGLKRFPYCDKIKFKRSKKYPKRERYLKLERWSNEI